MLILKVFWCLNWVQTLKSLVWTEVIMFCYIYSTSLRELYTITFCFNAESQLFGIIDSHLLRCVRRSVH